MKIASADIAHKSDLGLVRLGVEGAADVRRTYDEFLAIARRRAKGAHGRRRARVRDGARAGRGGSRPWWA